MDRKHQKFIKRTLVPVFSVARTQLRGKAKIALRVGRLIERFKMAKHFVLEIEEDAFGWKRNETKIAEEAALDGMYVVRTSVDQSAMSASEAVERYKDLGAVEQAFRCIKTVDLKVRPIHHRLEGRVRAHVFLCMLAYYVEWHMRKALAPMLFGDEARASRAKMSLAQETLPECGPQSPNQKTLQDPVHSFQTLLIFPPSFATPSHQILRALRLGNKKQNPQLFSKGRLICSKTSRP